MATLSEPVVIQPLGKRGFVFPKSGKRAQLSITNANSTRFGWLVAYAKFKKHLGIIDRLPSDCQVKQTGPFAAQVHDGFQSFIFTILADGHRF
jgi:hypothetical protein